MQTKSTLFKELPNGKRFYVAGNSVPFEKIGDDFIQVNGYPPGGAGIRVTYEGNARRTTDRYLQRFSAHDEVFPI